MKQNIFILILFLCFSCVKKKGNNYDSFSCEYKKTSLKRKDVFPFYLEKIEIVSFQNKSQSFVRNDSFLLKKFDTTLILNEIQKDTLFSVLYDYRSIPKEDNGETTVSVADCYNPHEEFFDFLVAEHKKQISIKDTIFPLS